MRRSAVKTVFDFIISPLGVRGQTLPALAPTQSDLHDAGVVIPGWPMPASEARKPVAPPTEAATQGPVNPSGVVGAAAATTQVPTTSDLIGAGVIHVR